MNDSDQLIARIWDRLLSLRFVSFTAVSESKSFTMEGEGTVEIQALDHNHIEQRDRGSWRGEREQRFTFSNSYRWSRAGDNAKLAIEHTRHGQDRAVYLLTLTPDAERANVCCSEQPHLCGADLYRAELTLDTGELRLRWEITGPEKRDQIDARYR